MRKDVLTLIQGTNDLQEVVRGLLLLYWNREMNVRYFLSVLRDEDFSYLEKLTFQGKLLYLERRYEMFRNGAR